MKISYEGVVLGVLVGLDANSLVTTRVVEIQATFEGFNGDRHAGFTLLSDGRTPHYPRGTVIRNNRQVSLVSAEELADIAERMGLADVQPEWLGANLLLEGIPNLTRLPPSSRIFFSQGAALIVTNENNPCDGPGKVIQAQYPDQPGAGAGFVKAAHHRRGLVAVVEKPGVIAVGDRASVYVPDQYRYVDQP